MKRRLKFGVQAAPEGTSWEELRRTWKLVEELGYDTAWTYDHFIPSLMAPFHHPSLRRFAEELIPVFRG
jgi:alkanesulfonate monooxygenase SsuD/methylene tetrahydromethanopterin reductase-like flavin-dependent oxidoreductase (luciferase family)